ncbi:SMI1/KNR4 family protein [Actinacidiphila acididurans]|uniref:SMI1/KNR4 family protein n=1 Tax=Actinacidiphila acididurans TaxID=2784346 RepID=A0ABS2U2J5_9ACTN|nr:SMI1/KNR4 family protein [Actinacidiphila acididurans]MBM9508961.1 SMI1/KNR4 family protein [Actinacidiphila acididurans]
MSSIHDFATWEPLLRLAWASNAGTLAVPGGHAAGRIGRGYSSTSGPQRVLQPGHAAARVGDIPDEKDAVQRVRDALADSGTDDIAYAAEITASGSAVLHVINGSPAAEPGVADPHPGALIFVEGALPEPWRRLPDPVPGAAPAPSADPALVERALRERFPDAIGASEAEIAAAEARLGVALPDELKALYRVTRARWEDWGEGDEAWWRVVEAVGCELLPLDEVYVADARSRLTPWRFAAMEAIEPRPGGAVQQLVGSPGWIVFGDADGSRIAVDLTPGPRGHVGQIIHVSHEDKVGAGLVADSLADLVMHVDSTAPYGDRSTEPSPVAHVNRVSLQSIEAAAHPGLEVLSIGVWDGEPFSLAAVLGLPRLRTLSAYPGTLADPLEIAGLTGLEFLNLAPDDWRVLLDAGAVPRGLSAAAIEVRNDRHPLPVIDLANELLALWDRPPITWTTLEGRLGE